MPLLVSHFMEYKTSLGKLYPVRFTFPSPPAGRHLLSLINDSVVFTVTVDPVVI